METNETRKGKYSKIILKEKNNLLIYRLCKGTKNYMTNEN